MRQFSLRDWLGNLWYPLTVSVSDITVYVAMNLTVLILYVFLLGGGDKRELLQIINVLIEFMSLSKSPEALGE